MSIKDGNFEWRISGEHSRDGYALNVSKNSGLDQNNLNVWAFSPAIYLYPGADYTLSYYERVMSSGSGILKLGLKPAAGYNDVANDYKDATILAELTLAANTDWVERKYVIKVTAEGYYHIGFGISVLNSKPNISLDQIKVTTPRVNVFYNKQDKLSELSSLSSWRANSDGTGTAPFNFSDADQTFKIVNYPDNTSLKLSGSWTVSGTGSKVVLGDGTKRISMEVGNNSLTGTIDVADNATLIANASKIPTLGTLSPRSTVVFGPNTPTDISEGVEFGSVVFNTGKQNKFTRKVKVKGTLDLQNAKLELADNDLELEYDANIINGSTIKYVVLNGKGRLRKAIRAGSNEVVLPVGSKKLDGTTTYNPVKIKLAAGSQDDVFSVGIIDGVYGSYTNDVPNLTSALVSKVVNKTWIVSEDVKGGSDITLTLTWSATDALPGFNPNNCHIKHYENGAWDKYASGSATTSVIDGKTYYTISRPGIKSFSPFTQGSDDIVVLPVELIHFAAKATGKNTVELNWATATEKNSNYFAIERSTNGISFTEIARVNGVGTTSVRTNYSYTDKNPVPGTSYYRLRQVDLDGEFEVLPVRAVSLNLSQTLAMTLYPNPAQQGPLNLMVQGLKQGEGTQLTISDMMGRNVLQQVLQENEVVISTNGLKPGTYLVRIVSGSNTLTQKLLIR